MAKTVEIEWTSDCPMTDADGEPLERGSTGPLDEERARRLQATRFCTILDGGDPDLADSVESADSAKQEPDTDTDEDGDDTWH